jgi:hypothetical protein
MAAHGGKAAFMKLVMFTPVQKTSAIGRMARLVVKALCEGGHFVTVVRTELDERGLGEMFDFGVPVLSWRDSSEVLSATGSADGVVYQIGDHYPNHAGAVHWLERQSGIVCLHDFFLGDLFYGWLNGDVDRGTAVLKHWYGDAEAKGYFRHASSPDFIAATHQTAPLTEWIASQASAVISHSGWGMERVLAACSGPVRVVPLAYEAPSGIQVSSGTKTESNQRMRVLTVGHVNPNKRAAQVIRALGGHERLRSGATYTLAGAIQPEMRRQLEELAQNLGVDLRVYGEVTDAELGQLLGQADVVCCLRNPTLEAASASTIEAMLSARTVIVEDAGFYAELPDHCVLKIRPDHEEEDLREALLSLSSESHDSKKLGERASVWARGTFTAENYVSQLLELVPFSQKSMLLSETMQVYARQLEQWGGAEAVLALPETLTPLRIFESNAATLADLGQA